MERQPITCRAPRPTTRAVIAFLALLGAPAGGACARGDDGPVAFLDAAQQGAFNVGTALATLSRAPDPPDIRRLMGLILREAGYGVLEASSRAEAVQCCAAPAPISLLVCDVRLPGDCGPDAARALTALRPGLRTLFVSGLPYEDAVGGTHVPAGCGFLLKPFSPAALQAKAAELLRGPLSVAS
jgi:CheY-like chemotaxis protein